MSDSGVSTPSRVPRPLSRFDRGVILTCAFLGWMCAGFHMAITSLAMQPAARDLLIVSGEIDGKAYAEYEQRSNRREAASSVLTATERARLEGWKSRIKLWFSWYQCAFLFGAATGGLCFGRLGDRWGRSRAMSLSILTYSLMAGAASQAQAPWQLLVLWFLACTGVGGMWPNGVALVSEVWSSLSRPAVAGLIGTSANIGIFIFATISSRLTITQSNWQWTMWAGALPVVLGLISLRWVRESPQWLQSQVEKKTAGGSREPARTSSTWDVFRPGLRGVTCIGILLATIPMVGAWGSANWMVPWADDAGRAASGDYLSLKEHVQQARSLTGIVGSLLGGWLGSLLGRRLCYSVTSLAALIISQYTFWMVVPTDQQFLVCVAILGFFSGIYFGWLPLFLPELFPTAVRSTGAGVSFNFGRILTAVTIFASGMMTQYFNSDYAQIGRITSLIFLLGVGSVFLAPAKEYRQLVD